VNLCEVNDSAEDVSVFLCSENAEKGVPFLYLFHGVLLLPLEETAGVVLWTAIEQTVVIDTVFLDF
jgi:hypothetical protein